MPLRGGSTVTPETIAQTRAATGMTQAEAAALVPVDRVSWARYESGKRTMPEYLWRYWLHVAGVERLPWSARLSKT